MEYEKSNSDTGSFFQNLVSEDRSTRNAFHWARRTLIAHDAPLIAKQEAEEQEEIDRQRRAEEEAQISKICMNISALSARLKYGEDGEDDALDRINLLLSELRSLVSDFGIHPDVMPTMSQLERKLGEENIIYEPITYKIENVTELSSN